MAYESTAQSASSDWCAWLRLESTMPQKEPGGLPVTITNLLNPVFLLFASPSSMRDPSVGVG
jgi:hypothetical protein